jgi:hypothetical protein
LVDEQRSHHSENNAKPKFTPEFQHQESLFPHFVGQFVGQFEIEVEEA